MLTSRLDINDITAPHPYRCRNPRRLAEGVIAQLQDRETVNLTHDGSISFQVDRLAQHLLLHQLRHTIETEDLSGNGLLDVFCADHRGPGFSGKLI